MGFARGLYFCGLNIYNIIKDLPRVCLDGGQHIRLVCVCPHADLNFPTVECLCVFVVSRFAVNLVCRCNDLVQICRHPHFVCIGCRVFPLQRLRGLRPYKFIAPIFVVQDLPAVPHKAIRESFLDCLLHHRLPVFLRNTFQNILVDLDVRFSVRILSDLKPHPIRRAVAFNGSGVFFCRPQVVHRLFRVRKIGILQGLLLRLGKVLGVQRRPVLRVFVQNFLCLADDAVQKLLHRVHGLGNGTCLARILFRLFPLEPCPSGHILHGLKNAAPAFRHQLFRRLFIGQVLGCIILHLVPDHAVHLLIACALCHVLQRHVHQRLCALCVQSVVPVKVLVQDRAEHILAPVSKIDLCRFGVNARLCQLAGCAVRSPQHALQNGIRAGARCVQPDQLGRQLVRRPQAAFPDHPALAAGALAAKRTAQPACRFGLALPLRPRCLQSLPAAGLLHNVVCKGRQSAGAARQLHRLVKGLYPLHLSKPVHAARRRGIPVKVCNAVRHHPADGLARAPAHLPPAQLPLYAALLFGQALLPQSVGFPQRAALGRVCFPGLYRLHSFHTFPGLFHVDLSIPLWYSSSSRG